jgi:hypothetical protein
MTSNAMGMQRCITEKIIFCHEKHQNINSMYGVRIWGWLHLSRIIKSYFSVGRCRINIWICLFFLPPTWTSNSVINSASPNIVICPDINKYDYRTSTRVTAIAETHTGDMIVSALLASRAMLLIFWTKWMWRYRNKDYAYFFTYDVVSFEGPWQNINLLLNTIKN